MNSEKMLLNMYKKNQYESTRNNIQRLVMITSSAGIAVAVVLTAFLVSEPISMYLFISVLVCIAAAFLLQQLKVVSLNTASLIYFIYISFLFIPANWYFTGGLSGSTQYVALIVMLAVMLAFTGKTQKRMQIIYLALVLALIIFSIVTAPDIIARTETIYKSTAFFISIVLIAFYMLFMLKKYDLMHDKFLHGSIKDDLTRVFSRSVLGVIIDYAEKQYHSKKTDYVMIMIDVDNFKKLNDEFGHIVGDIVLRNTAVCIRDHMREEDFVVRYGGDEFLVVLIGTSIASASKILDRINEEQKCERLLDFHITFSRGFAARSECGSAEEVIKLADKRMFEDKAGKR